MKNDKRKKSKFHGKVSIFKEVNETPSRYLGNLCPTNLQEQKERFLKYGILPKFKMRTSQAEIDRITARSKGQIKFDLLEEAKTIIQKVKKEFGDGQKYLESAYGPPTDYVTGTEIIAQYLKESNCEGEITVYWTQELECSAKMMWHGPNLKYNRPEARRYTLIIKNSPENQLMRSIGIHCLADHEIGTHYMRMTNDGLQPWFSDRKKFGLRPMSCRESSATEEGLATLNTVLNSRSKYLWKAALTYYTACMAMEMTFRELFMHLEKFIHDPEQRWKQVMRVKRGLADCNSIGGYGNDQVYFEGAVEIIRNLDQIDFSLLYSGKVCVDELPRIRRLARLDCIKLPKFLKDIEKYKRSLRQIGYANRLISRPDKKCFFKCDKANSAKIASEESTSPTPMLFKKRFPCFPRCGSSSLSSVSPSPPLPAPPMKTNKPEVSSNISQCFKCSSFSDDENEEEVEAKSSLGVMGSGKDEKRLLSRPKDISNTLLSTTEALRANRMNPYRHIDSSSLTGDYFGFINQGITS